MFAPFLLILVSGVPLALALACASRPLRVAAPWLAPLAALPALWVALSALMAADLPWLGLGARMETDAIRVDFLLFTALLWTLASVSAALYLRDDALKNRFFVLFLLAMAGNLGLIVAADAMTFYAHFAMMSLASWGLVLHARSDFSRFAGRTYIAFAVAGELALFAGLALAASAAGSSLLVDMAGPGQPMLASLLILAGFGIKLGIVPLHLWLPLAHAAAPAPASAVLSGAMIKAGLFGMMVVLPFGVLSLPDPGLALAIAGAVSIVAAALIGVTQTNPKAVLAYSSVGQMGLAAMILGTALVAPEVWPAAAVALTLFAAHHAFAKAALFLGVPVVWATEGRTRAGILALMAIPAAALAAAPSSSGALAKSELSAVLSAGLPAWYPWLYAFLVLGSVGTSLLMVRFVVLMAREARKPNMTRALAAPWLAMTGLAGAGFWVLPLGAAASDGDPLSDAVPVLAALALAALAYMATRMTGLRSVEVPPGEVLALFLRGAEPATMPAIRLPQPTFPRLPRRFPEIERTGGFALLIVAAALIVVTGLSIL